MDSRLVQTRKIKKRNYKVQKPNLTQIFGRDSLGERESDIYIQTFDGRLSEISFLSLTSIGVGNRIRYQNYDDGGVLVGGKGRELRWQPPPQTPQPEDGGDRITLVLVYAIREK